MLHPYYLFGGIVGIFLISSVVNGSLKRAAASLDVQTRERIFQRESRGKVWWNSIDTVGGLLLILGFFKAYGMLPAVVKVPWGYPSMALGLFALCVSSSLRSWMISTYYQAEAPNTPVQIYAARSAWLTSIAEMSFGLAICWWIFVPLIGAQAAAKPALQAQRYVPASDNSAPKQIVEKIWVPEKEALNLLPGKDAKYLKRLALKGEVRTKLDEGETVYNRDEIVKTIEAGLPIYTDADFKNDEKKDDAAKPDEKPKDDPPPVKPIEKPAKPKQDLKEE